MSEDLSFEKAVELLKTIVKYSNVPGQKHLDFSLVNAPELDLYEKAMEVAQKKVKDGELTRDQLLEKLNLV